MTNDKPNPTDEQIVEAIIKSIQKLDNSIFMNKVSYAVIAEYALAAARPMIEARMVEREFIAMDALRCIREIWAGCECGVPKYAQEAYAIGIAKKMYQEAVNAIAALEEK